MILVLLRTYILYFNNQQYTMIIRPRGCFFLIFCSICYPHTCIHILCDLYLPIPEYSHIFVSAGRCLKEKQQILIDKHNKVNERAGDLLAGGGVSMWPEMTNMRLSSNDSLCLIIICVTLIAGSATLFKLIHGNPKCFSEIF